MKHFLVVVLAMAPLWLVAQQRGKGDLPDVSMTIKGDLVLPVSLKNPLFNATTETIGQLGGSYQVPLYKGLGLGIGGNHTWWSIKERSLAPAIITGEVRRAVLFGKVQYEQYTGDRTFYELNMRVGTSTYTYDCKGCAGGTEATLFWSLGVGYFVHATDNLAFGFSMAFDTTPSRFNAADLGLKNFPGRPEVEEAKPYQNLLFGLGFSTRLRKNERDVRGW